ncbi:MAG TPA: phospholipase D-like domain-containing protein [Polyangiaceae bacterium]|nr:phospholipase D-like domain-containing protein [Polyangiaceae bacterium]
MKKQAKTIVVTALATAIAILLVMNLSSGEKKIDPHIAPLYGVDDPQFARSMGHLLGPPVVGDNRVDELRNGAQIFPAMLAAIEAAERTINFETYIYWSGEVGRRFSEALAAKARAGVKVYVLLDWVGSSQLDGDLLGAMKAAGVEVEKYHKPGWFNLTSMNNRTHRKLLVVDGKVGFTGGVGIADKWDGAADGVDHWRDSHYRVEGPVVAQMQAAFMDNWLKSHSEVPHGETYFPPLAPAGPSRAQVFKSSPAEGSASARLMYLLSIAAARRSVHIANSYFVPDDSAVEALVEARRRGVKVEVVVPGEHIDTEITRKASKSRWGALLEAGVDIYEYGPTMYHCKAMIVDGVWVSVGSTNFDSRSFRLNDEANLNVLDAAFAAQALASFEDDKAKSTRVTLAGWQGRPLAEKATEFLAGLLRAQL